jgi:hypothetical protein
LHGYCTNVKQAVTENLPQLMSSSVLPVPPASLHANCPSKKRPYRTHTQDRTHSNLAASPCWQTTPYEEAMPPLTAARTGCQNRRIDAAQQVQQELQ